MDLRWEKTEKFLTAGDRQIECWCKVRNELNGFRPRKNGDAADLFCATIPGGKEGAGPPSMPRTFPVGEWRLTGIKSHPDQMNDGYLYPYYIGFNAWQYLDEWELDDGGHYLRKTGKLVIDTGYGAHYSSCDWTQGCIRIAKKTDLLWLVSNCRINDPFIVTDKSLQMPPPSRSGIMLKEPI